MKKLILLTLLLAYAFCFAQSRIRVIDEDTKKPIPNAKILCNHTLLGETNTKGEVTFKTKCRKIQIEAENYFKESANVEDIMHITLLNKSSKTQSIEAIILENKSDPRALEILRNVDRNFRKNSPLSLDNYTHKSYEKVSLDIDEDSISAYKSLFTEQFNFFRKKQKKDSIDEVSTKKIFAKSKLFLWERAQEFLYSKKWGEKINILDNKISGLKQPINEIIVLQGNRNKIPPQIKQENRGLYHFYLTDTIVVEGRKNFVIRFREATYKKSVKKRKYSGYLYIDTETYGIKKIESASKNKNEGHITSEWILYEEKWFLAKENIKLRMSRMTLESEDRPFSLDSKFLKKKKIFGAYAYLTSRFFDFKTPVEENHKDFRGYTFNIKNADGKSLDLYRKEPLSLREQKTYSTIDSLGKRYEIDRKARLLTSFINGQIRIGTLDLDVGEIANFNSYEGLRLGMKVKTNETFHPYFSPDYYFAYGFRDDKLKYGIGLDMKTSLNKNAYFRLEYYDDVNASGEFYRRLWNFKLRMMNYGNNINNDKYYRYSGVSLSYLNDVTNGLTLIFAGRRNQEEALFNYDFRNAGNVFQNTSTLLTLKYSPNSTNIMTPQGKSIIDQRYPELYFNFEQSFKAFGGDFNYTRFDALYIQNFKTRLGTTGLRLYGGLVLGEAPIWKHFTMNGLSSPSKDVNFNLTSFLGFATLEGGKYYNDRFIAYYFTHKLPWYTKSFGQNVSSFDLVLRGTIGNMKHPKYHQFEFQKLNHLYQELGIEWNNFLSSYFNLGIFYRIGYYMTPYFNQNFAIQFKLKLLEF